MSDEPPPTDSSDFPGPGYVRCEDPDCPHLFAYELRDGSHDPHFHPKPHGPAPP